jgi:hypothetical protein
MRHTSLLKGHHWPRASGANAFALHSRMKGIPPAAGLGWENRTAYAWCVYVFSVQGLKPTGAANRQEDAGNRLLLRLRLESRRDALLLAQGGSPPQGGRKPWVTDTQ